MPSRLNAPLLLFAAVLTGALLLAAAQFMPLYHTHMAGVAGPVASGTVGGAHGYALLPVAVLAAVLGIVVWRAQSRPALLAAGVLGAAALVIALAHDLSAAHARGLRLVSGHYQLAANQATFGFYVETLGALVLLLSCVCGFLLIGSPRAAASGPARSAREPRGAERPSGP